MLFVFLFTKINCLIKRLHMAKCLLLLHTFTITATYHSLLSVRSSSFPQRASFVSFGNLTLLVMNYFGFCFSEKVSFALIFESYSSWLMNSRLKSFLSLKMPLPGPSLVVQCLRLCAPNAGGLVLSPGQGTRSRMPQLRVRMLQLKNRSCMTQWRLKIMHATSKTRLSQINTNKIFF